MEAPSNIDSCLNLEDDCLPSSEDLEEYYNMLENDKIPEIQWTSPGRISPLREGSKLVAETETVLNNVDLKEVSKTDFDFSDDIIQPQMRVRSQHTTPKSAKKKTANFAGVMEVLKKKNAECS